MRYLPGEPEGAPEEELLFPQSQTQQIIETGSVTPKGARRERHSW